MKRFHLNISDPCVIVQGEAGDQKWGHYQFPSLKRSTDGCILAYWSYGNDSMEGGSHDGGIKAPYVSYNNGQSWAPADLSLKPKPKWKMSDGKYFCGFTSRGGHPMPEEWWNRYTHYAEWDDQWESGFRMYFAQDLEKNDDTIVKASIFDPVTGETEDYEPIINWPHAPIVYYPGGRIYPLTQVFALSNNGIIEHDGLLYICLYFNGFDSFAKTREDAAKQGGKYYSVYVFSSDDNARTWNLISQIPTPSNIVDGSSDFEGFCETMMTCTPDGSFVMLMRTGCTKPSYIVRSEDNCRTWSAPVKFDDCGVFPQIITLGCGVTLAGYGRPVMCLRATDDPSGIIWDDPITIPIIESGWETHYAHASCYYTNFLPLDDYSALWIYTEFRHLNENGDPARAVLVRKLTAVPNEK